MLALLALSCAGDASFSGLSAASAAEPSAEAAPARVDCEDESRASEPLARTCVTADLRCGETLYGHTGGGATNWSGDFYRSKFCSPENTETYLGPERVYWLDTPPETEVRVSLESPCADLDLFVVTWSDPASCPGPQHLVSDCEAHTRPGGGEVKLQNLKNGYTYLVAVEARGGEAAPFALTAQCQALNPR